MSEDPAGGASPRPTTRPSPRWWRIPALAAAALAVVAAVGAAALGGGAGGGLVRGLLQAKLARRVEFSRLAITGAPAGLRLVFSDLRIGQPSRFGPGDLVRMPRAEFVLRLAPLLVGRIEAPEVRLTSPELHLRRLGPGLDNWTFGHGGGASGMLGATRVLAITGGRVTMDDPSRSLTLQAAFSNDPAVPDLPLSLQGGGVLQGEAYRAVARGGPLNGRKPHAPSALVVDLVDGAARVRLSGVSQAPFDFRGLDLDVDAQGPNLADLIYLFNLQAPNSPPFTLRAHLHREDKRFTVTGIQGRLGDSDLEGEVRSDHLQRRRIAATLRSHRLTAHDLRVLLASPPPHATARARPGVSGVGRTPRGRVFSETPISFRRLQGGEDALDYHADTAAGFGLPVTGADLRLRVSEGRMAMAPLSFGVAGGTVRIDYALDTRTPSPEGRLAARVRGLRLAQAGKARAVGGRLDADVEVRGSGASVARQAATAQGRASLRVTSGALPRLDAMALSGDVFGALGALLEPKAKTPLRCVAADFAIGSGVARATRLVVATAQGTATGGGEVDLRDERLHLQVRASAQGARPLVQLRAPILVEGVLAHPHVSMKAPPVAEGVSGLFHSLGRLVGGGAARRPAPASPPPSC